MRAVTVVVLALFAAPVFAANLQGLVFGYECRHINPKETGFTCSINKEDKTRITIHFVDDFRKLPKKEHEYKGYRFHALLVRYFELGGKWFDLTYANSPGKTVNCYRVKGKKFSYLCN